MLHKNVILPEVLFLIEELMEIPLIHDYRLVGGTALALQMGHRFSDDIDLFTDKPLDVVSIEEMAKARFSERGFLKISTFPYGVTIYLSLDNKISIKIDIMNYHSEPFLESALSIDGIRMAGLKDLAAMKLQAITTRKEKKDFIDIWLLTKTFSLDEMLDWYEKRFQFYDRKDVELALGNIDLADAAITPKLFIQEHWGLIKDHLKVQLRGLFK